MQISDTKLYIYQMKSKINYNMVDKNCFEKL